MSQYKTTIEINGEVIFEIKFDDEAPMEHQRTWVCRTLSDKKLHTKALLELNKIAFEVAQRKIQRDEKRLSDSNDAITLG